MNIVTLVFERSFDVNNADYVALDQNCSKLWQMCCVCKSQIMS